MPPSKERIQNMIESSMNYKEQQHERWDNSIALYRGKMRNRSQQESSQDRPWVHSVETNFTRPTIDNMLPSIIFKSPKIMVRTASELATPEDQTLALGIETKLNAIQTELNMGREYKRATKDALMHGIGYVKYGLTTDANYDVDRHPFAAPFMKRTSPWEVGIDPVARETDLSDASYIWFMVITPLEKARQDPLLDKTKRMHIKPQAIQDFLPKHVKERMDKHELKGFEYAVLFEIWDRDNKRLYVTDREGNIYRDSEWPYDLRGMFPLVIITFNNVSDEIYAMSEADFIKDLQLEASEKRSQQLNHTRRWNRKYWAPPDMADDDKNALERGEDGTVVRASVQPQPIADAPLPNDVTNEIGMIQSEVKETSGISAYQRGGSEKNVYSATEAKIIDSAANIRVEERRGVVADAIAMGAQILYRIMMEENQWPDLSFKFTVDITTMLRPDDEGRRQQLIQMGEILMKSPRFREDQWIKDVALAFNKPPEQYLLSDQEFQQKMQNQPPDPEQVKAQMEQQALQMKMQIDQQKAQAELQIAQQKAQIELQLAQQKMQFEAQLMAQKLEFEREMGELKMGLEQQKAQLTRENQIRQMRVDQLKSETQLRAEKQKAIRTEGHEARMQKIKEKNANAPVQNKVRPVSKGE